MNNKLEYLNKYKLFIVDYDGTLIDSMGMWRHLLSSFLKDNNISFDVDIDEISKEQTNSESVKYIHDNYFSNITYKELENKMYEYVKKQYVLQKEKLGAKAFLKELKKYGKVVLFSATANELLNDSFKTNGLDEYLDYVYSASNMNTTKTNGIGFLKIIELENIKKEDALVVEDIYHAIKGAKEQGFATLAVYDNQDDWNEIINISNYNLNYKDLN
ncbi:MAG: HAD family phosphatase [Acholeplasmatales bacterium]|nr:HAD family phosphatase [Acholeplasmatales bacterium]